MPDDINKIKTLLHKIQTSYAHVRAGYITELQNKIWDEINEPVEIQEVLDDLAFNLNFYESDVRDRDEAEGYFGDERLTEIINAVLEKI